MAKITITVTDASTVVSGAKTMNLSLRMTQVLQISRT